MRYRDIHPTASHRRLSASHPFLAEVVIDPVDWFDFERLDANSPVTRIVGHDILDGRMTVFVACSSDEVRQRLEDGWS